MTEPEVMPFGDERPKRNIDMNDEPIIIEIDGYRFTKNPREALNLANVITATVQCWLTNNVR